MAINKKISLFFVLLLFVISFTLEFHQHPDRAAHTDCALCLVLHNANSASISHRESGPAFRQLAFLKIPARIIDPYSHPRTQPVIRPPPK
jgi:hypothetical protein